MQATAADAGADATDPPIVIRTEQRAPPASCGCDLLAGAPRREAGGLLARKLRPVDQNAANLNDRSRGLDEGGRTVRPHEVGADHSPLRVCCLGITGPGLSWLGRATGW